MRLQHLLFAALPLLARASAPAAPEQMVLAPPAPYTPQISAQPTLADLLTIEPYASIFYTYARELALSEALADAGARLTLLVPTNKAIMALARKPHQEPVSGPSDGDIEISEEEFDARSKARVEQWVSAHIVPQSPIDLNRTYMTLLRTPVAFETLDNRAEGNEWAHVLINGETHILAKRQALNGAIYLIDGTLTE